MPPQCDRPAAPTTRQMTLEIYHIEEVRFNVPPDMVISKKSGMDWLNFGGWISHYRESISIHYFMPFFIWK